MEEKIKYRYTASGRSGTRQVFPANGQNFAITYNESEDRLDYEVSLSEKLMFKGEDFSWLYFLEKTIYRCDYIGITIEKYCSGAWSPFFIGKMSLNSGDPWNLDKGTVELAISESQNYECVDQGEDVELNLFEHVFPRTTVKTIEGTIEEQSFNINFDTGENPDLFPGETDPYLKGWQQSYIRYHYVSESDPDPHGNTVDVTWVREVITVHEDLILSPPWIYIGPFGVDEALYARQAIVYNPVRSQFDPNNPNDYSISYTVLSGDIDNGLDVRKCFEAFLQEICPHLTLESDFFQWNPTPEGASNINYATGLKSKVLHWVLFQKSDVKRPNANNNATIVTTNFADLLKDICNIAQLKYAVTDDNKFKIEHVDYYKDPEVGLDTTTPELVKNTRGNRSYSYDKDKIPKNETFKFMEPSYGDFQGRDIVYSGSCAGQGDTKEIAYNVEKITTDVILCLSNPDPDSKVSDDGFVLIAVNGANAILSEASILGGNILNNTLAWAQLHRDYWRYNRAQKTFNMNGSLTTALSVKPTKLQTDFSISLCCTVFDPKLFVKTSLSDLGTVKSASYDMYTEKLTLSVLHSADDGLQENDKPITIGDTASTFKNYPVIIDVLANDSDPDGSIIPSSLKIVFPPSNGTAEITPDFKVLYTPTTDYVGSDLFVYNVEDNFKEPSANTIVNITVNAGTPNVVANPDSYSISSTAVLNVPAPGILSNDTGPSALTAIPETKATTSGGSVQIFGNGSFQYTPPAVLPPLPFVDTFSYNAKDINDLMDEATVSIDVFEPEDVWVSILKLPDDTSTIFENCEGATQPVGERTINDFQLYFFSDAAKTISLDVTNYGLSIEVEYETLDHGSPVSSYTRNISPEGEVYDFENDLETQYIYDGCDLSANINTTLSLSLLPGTGYNI